MRAAASERGTGSDGLRTDGREDKLTRRTFLMRAAGTGIAMVGSPALLAACTTTQPAGATASNPTASAAASTSRTGGRITGALLAEPSGTDPQLFPQATAMQVQYRVYEQLVTLDST